MLLKQIGIVPDQVVSPDIDETPRRDELPRPYAERMARAKAAAVVSPTHLVLAADTERAHYLSVHLERYRTRQRHDVVHGRELRCVRTRLHQFEKATRPVKAEFRP